MRRWVRWPVAVWLAVAVAGQLLAFEAVRRAFVGTVRGQRLDAAALSGNQIGRQHLEQVVDAVLGGMTTVSLLAAIAVIGFLALARRQVGLAAVATGSIAGANLTTQLLKWGIDRPELGVDLARSAAGNSLPSGHTTVAVSVVLALVLVLPTGWRSVAALAGAGYAALAGAATLAAGWHRPSDAVAAVLVAGAWAALAGLLLALLRRRRRPEPPPRYATGGLLLLGVGLLLAALVALAVTDRATAAGSELDRAELLAAYAGGVAGIAAVTCLVVAVVLVSAARVVGGGPGHRTGRPAAGAAGRPAAGARWR